MPARVGLISSSAIPVASSTRNRNCGVCMKTRCVLQEDPNENYEV